MQNTIHEIDYLEYCYSLIEKQCEWGNRKNWKNSNFEELSFRISQKSNITISPGTLKRIYGKVKTSEDYQPQQATKDAMAIYLDYKNWSNFKTQNKDVLSGNSTSKSISFKERSFRTSRKEKQNKRNKRLILINAFVVLIIFFAYNKINKSNPNIDFQGKHLKGKAYHTAVFDYDISKSKQDFFIDFGDEKREKLDPEENTISHYYMLPDNYNVKLLRNNTVLKDTFVYMSTTGWEGYANVLGDNIRYFPIKQSITKNKALKISPEIVQKSGVDTNEIYWTHFCNIKSFGVSGDNFKFSTKVKNKPEIVAVRCNHIKIDLIGESGRIALYFVKQGCAKWVKIKFGEIEVNGENNDLTEFGKDFSKLRNIKVNVENQKVTVWYEDNIIYGAVYNKSIGNIVGLKYSFTGCGEIKDIEMTDLEGNPVYEYEF